MNHRDNSSLSTRRGSKHRGSVQYEYNYDGTPITNRGASYANHGGYGNRDAHGKIKVERCDSQEIGGGSLHSSGDIVPHFRGSGSKHQGGSG